MFLVPFALALIYLAVYTLTGLEIGEAEVDADTDFTPEADHDIDLHAEVESADPDLDAGGGIDVDHTVDHAPDLANGGHALQAAGGASAQQSLGWSHALLAMLGVGRVPVSLLVMFLFMTWGVIGFVVNQLFRDQFTHPTPMAAISIPIAGIGAILVTRILASLVHRYLPMNETYATRRHELLGLSGEAIYNIDSAFGMVSVKDARGNLFQVGCRVAANAKTIAQGSQVKLVAYNADENLYHVEPEVRA